MFFSLTKHSINLKTEKKLSKSYFTAYWFSLRAHFFALKRNILNGWYWSTSNKTLLLFNNTLFDSTQKELQNEGWTTVQVRRRPKYFAKKHAITDKYHLSGNGLYCHSEQSSVFWWKQKGCNCSLEKLTLGKMLGWFLFISSNHFKITFSDSNKLFFEELSNLVIMTLGCNCFNW